MEWLALSKQSDKAVSRFSAHPVGLAEQFNFFVTDFRQATSMSVIAAFNLNSSASQSRSGLVRRLLESAILSAGSFIFT